MVVSWEVGSGRGFFLMTENLLSQKEEMQVVSRLSKSKGLIERGLVFIGGEGPSERSRRIGCAE